MNSFGKFLRTAREAAGIGLNEMARMAEMSPTFLSLIERGLQPPPGVEKLQALARLLQQQPDEFLARAGKLPPDIPAIIQRHQRHYAALLRSLRKLSENQLDAFIVQLSIAIEAKTNLGKPAQNKTGIDQWLLFTQPDVLQSLPSSLDLKPLAEWRRS